MLNHDAMTSEKEAFKRFLVSDYVLDSSEKRYYLYPARNGDQLGRIVGTEWPFLPSPCIFLRNNKCGIEEVKPKGGRELFCRLMNASNHNLTGYGKKIAASDWNRSPLLNLVLSAAIRNESETEPNDRRIDLQIGRLSPRHLRPCRLLPSPSPDQHT